MISVRNNTIAYNGRRASLLVHPNGLELLRYYIDLKSKPTSTHASKVAGKLQQQLDGIILVQKETDISSQLRKILKESWVANSDGQCSVTGEKEETGTVKGTLSQESATGSPDIVVRMGFKNKLVVMVMEVSVDSNGGENKVGQGLDYASLIDKPNETILLLTLNFDRKLKGCDLKITQEAFLYLHSDDESNRVERGVCCQ
jgi:hypothetical protein